ASPAAGIRRPRPRIRALPRPCARRPCVPRSPPPSCAPVGASSIRRRTRPSPPSSIADPSSPARSCRRSRAALAERHPTRSRGPCPPATRPSTTEPGRPTNRARWPGQRLGHARGLLLPLQLQRDVDELVLLPADELALPGAHQHLRGRDAVALGLPLGVLEEAGVDARVAPHQRLPVEQAFL